MTTILDKTLKRELEIGKQPFILTVSPEGFRLVPKGKRKGYEMLWSALVSGDAALAAALNASLGLSTSPSHSRRDAKKMTKR